MKRRSPQCRYCSAALPRDTVALNRKLFGADLPREQWRCLDCLAGFLDCSVDDLREKIADFKRVGCALFE